MTAPSTIAPDEATRFGAMAADWWNPTGSSAALHQLNPVRLAFIRRVADSHFGAEASSRRPLTGRTALDAGCGAGLLCEPLARLGATVTGVDAAPENIAVARDHAAQSGLTIDYRAGEVGALDQTYDLVTSMEVIEHVVDPAAFIAALVDRLAPGGLLILSTPNRTLWSRLLVIDLAEGLGKIPRGTHDWSKFVRPDEMAALIDAAGLRLIDQQGIGWSPASGFTLGGSDTLNYILAATRR